MKTGTSLFSNAAGLTGWRWELAYLYTDCMTSVCMNGQSSVIQKTALLGSEANRKVTVYGKRNAMSSEGLGLLDLLKIKLPVVEGILKSSFALFLLICCLIFMQYLLILQEMNTKIGVGESGLRPCKAWCEFAVTVVAIAQKMEYVEWPGPN